MAIEIRPSEIESVDSIGSLDGEDVRLVRTFGGLYLALGKLKGKNSEEVLAAGSHPGIVRYNIEKSYKTFQASMMKSEHEHPNVVSGMSDLLPKKMRDSGYDFYVVKKSNEFDMILTKSQIEVLKFEAHLAGSDLVVHKSDKIVTSDLAPVAAAATQAAAIIAIDEGKDGIVHANMRFNPKSVLRKL